MLHAACGGRFRVFHTHLIPRRAVKQITTIIPPHVEDERRKSIVQMSI